MSSADTKTNEVCKTSSEFKKENTLVAYNDSNEDDKSRFDMSKLKQLLPSWSTTSTTAASTTVPSVSDGASTLGSDESQLSSKEDGEKDYLINSIINNDSDDAEVTDFSKIMIDNLDLSEDTNKTVHRMEHTLEDVQGMLETLMAAKDAASVKRNKEEMEQMVLKEKRMLQVIAQLERQIKRMKAKEAEMERKAMKDSSNTQRKKSSHRAGKKSSVKVEGIKGVDGHVNRIKTSKAEVDAVKSAKAHQSNRVRL